MITEELFNELKNKKDNDKLSLRQLSKYVQEKTGEIIPKSTLGDWLNGGYEKRKNKEVEEKFASDKTKVLTQAEVKYWKDLYNNAVRTVALQDLMVDTLKNTVSTLKPLPLVQYKPKLEHNSLHRAGLLISDFHYGEVVDIEQTGGLSQYSPEIASKRLHLLTNKVIELVDIKRKGLLVPDLDIFLLGDEISGNIHEELAETNATNILESTTQAAYLLSQSLGIIAPHFEHVRVFGVVGNHGRMTKKPRFKDRFTNWDYVCYQMMAMFLKEHKNVTFDISKSFFQPVQMLNTKLLLLHGDGIRGNLGIPWYGVERAIQRLRQMVDLKHDRFDKILLGHFHDPIETERYLVNSSFKGGDDFCWLPNQKVIMFDGSVKQISDVKIGDYVITGNGNKGLVTKVYCHDKVDEDVVRVYTPGKIIEGTANHHVESMTRIQDSKIQTDYHFKREYERRLDSLGETIGYRKKKACFLRSPKRNLIDGGSFDDGFLVGLYLADGSLNQDDQITFSLALHELDTISSFLNKWYINHPLINRGNGKNRYVHVKLEKNNKKGGNVWFAHKGLFNLINEWVGFHVHAADKKLTQMPLNKEFAKGVLFGWLGGDGTLNMDMAIYGILDKPVIGASKSENLIYQMRQLAIDMGFSVGMSYSIGGYKKDNKILRLDIRDKISPYLGRRIFNDCMGTPVLKIEKYKYTGKVYDLTIEDDHSYQIDGFAVHNSIGALFSANEPSQTLFYVNENHGIISTEKIYLKDADNNNTLGLDRGLKKVWADNTLDIV